jgi:hypothetical protein
LRSCWPGRTGNASDAGWTDIARVTLGTGDALDSLRPCRSSNAGWSLRSCVACIALVTLCTSNAGGTGDTCWPRWPLLTRSANLSLNALRPDIALVTLITLGTRGSSRTDIAGVALRSCDAR